MTQCHYKYISSDDHGEIVPIQLGECQQKSFCSTVCGTCWIHGKRETQRKSITRPPVFVVSLWFLVYGRALSFFVQCTRTIKGRLILTLKSVLCLGAQEVGKALLSVELELFLFFKICF